MSESLVGRKAPQFSLPDADGTVHRLADYRGRYVVLFFYPKDNTPGCTKEACGFRDNIDGFEEANAVVLGVSILDSKSKARFRDKHGLNFPLLADENHEVVAAYGVWREKSMYGKKFMGISRETFVVGPDGKVVHHWEKATGNEAHSAEVLKWLRENAG